MIRKQDEMATTAKSADSFAFREVTVDAPSEAPIVTAMPNDTLAPFQTFRQYLGHPARSKWRRGPSRLSGS